MNILVVDDEQEIRDYIARLPEWSKMENVQLISVANGVEAMAHVSQQWPDLVLTDIRMPQMDGFELARTIRQTNIDLPIIFLSAYHEFDYARQAISLGAIDFITKPFVGQDIVRAVEQNQYRQRRNRSSQEEIFAIFGTAGVREHEKQAWLARRNGSPEAIILLYAELDLSSGEGDSGIPFRQLKLASGIAPYLEACDVSHWTLDTANGLYILLGCGHSKRDFLRDAAFHLARQITHAYDGTEGESVSVGISEPQTALLRLPEAMEQTRECMDYRMLLGRNSVIAYRAVEKINKDRANAVLLSADPFPELFRSGDLQGIRDRLKDSYRRMLAAGVGKAEIQHFCIHLIEEMDHVLEAFGIPVDPKTVVGIRERILSGVILTDLMRVLETHLLQGAGNIRQQLDRSSKRLVIETKKIIDAEYPENLTLLGTADRLNVNFAYLSRLIKKETGHNFSDLLWERRIEAAKAKLIHDDLKAYEVAYAVGFKDATHFSQLFKKIVGVSPSVYRRLATAQQEESNRTIKQSNPII